MKELLAELVNAFAPSGFEDDMRRIVRSHVEPIADDVGEDRMGNLFAFRRGDGTGRKVMLAAHMDEIGLIVTKIEKNGLLRFSNIGFLPQKALLGQRVRFADGSIGIISHDGGLQAEIIESEIPKPGEWFIDMGIRSAADLTVGIGDVGVLHRPFADLGNRYVAGGFDDRAGCAVLIETLKRLPSSSHDILFAFTTQEEIGARGARVAAYHWQPEIALAVDVTPAGDTPKPKQHNEIKLGEGVAIKVADQGMIAHNQLRHVLVQVAKEHGIPYQLEVLLRGSTDAMVMQTTGAGVISGAVSIPCRYVHTHSEMIDADDLENTIRLLLAFLSGPIDLA